MDFYICSGADYFGDAGKLTVNDICQLQQAYGRDYRDQPSYVSFTNAMLLSSCNKFRFEIDLSHE